MTDKLRAELEHLIKQYCENDGYNESCDEISFSLGFEKCHDLMKTDLELVVEALKLNKFIFNYCLKPDSSIDKHLREGLTNTVEAITKIKGGGS